MRTTEEQAKIDYLSIKWHDELWELKEAGGDKELIGHLEDTATAITGLKYQNYGHTLLFPEGLISLRAYLVRWTPSYPQLQKFINDIDSLSTNPRSRHLISFSR